MNENRRFDADQGRRLIELAEATGRSFDDLAAILAAILATIGRLDLPPDTQPVTTARNARPRIPDYVPTPLLTPDQKAATLTAIRALKAARKPNPTLEPP